MTTQPHRFSFPTLLASTMAASTFGLVVFAVLASELISAFDIERWQVGALVTATTISGALVSPSIGGLTDRIGARNATVATLIVSGGALAAMARSPVFWLLALFALIGGIGMAIGNPATNKLISMHAPSGSRGVITGIKQSGVQMGTFLGGLLLPVIATSLGWRWAVGVFAAAALVGGLVAWAVLPRDLEQVAERVEIEESDAMPPVIKALAVYGFLLGFAGTAIFTYLPLYAEETLGFSRASGGYIVAFLGSVGVAGRIGWGRISEHRLGAMPSLRIIAVVSALSALMMIAASSVSWLVWIAAALAGLSASSWNAVGMLAVIGAVPTRLAGRGSGVVLFGFLMGLGIGAPAFGYSVDRLGTYTPGWLVISGVFLVALFATRSRVSLAQS